MAPKKRPQENKRNQKNNKPQPTSSISSYTAGPKLHLSAENEQRIRRLLLNKSAGGDTIRPTAIPCDESLSLSKFQQAKKLKSIYEKLSCEGFSDDQIESALSALKEDTTFEAALDWLCLNLSRDYLPLKFSNGSSLLMDGGGSVGIVSTAQEDWTPSVDTSADTEEKMPALSVRIKGKWHDDSLDSHEPSQADWIRQYMEKEEEVS
ncbi:hypothetical protein Dimus_018145 [Dionaea muscipula]